MSRGRGVAARTKRNLEIAQTSGPFGGHPPRYDLVERMNDTLQRRYADSDLGYSLPHEDSVTGLQVRARDNGVAGWVSFDTSAPLTLCRVSPTGTVTLEFRAHD